MNITQKIQSISFFNPTIIKPLVTKVLYVLLFLSILIVFRDFIEQYKLLENIIRLIITYFILSIIFKYGSTLINYFYRQRNKFQQSHVDNFTLGIKRLAFFFHHLIFVLIAIDVLFINILTLLTSLTIVAVAIVLTFKEFISNFLFGVAIMFSNNIKLKEYVKIGEFRGRIINLTFENIELKTDNGDIVFIPNISAYTKEITNFSKNPLKNINTTITLPKIVYPHFSKFKQNLKKKLLKKYSELIKGEQITINITVLNKDDIQVCIDIATTKYNFQLETQVINFINEIVIQELSKLEKKEEK